MLQKSIVYLFMLLTLPLFGQHNHPQDYFRSPLDIPLILSGTFGELRSNHFHAGIDIKTQGASGHNIYAVADGYVSRIKVSPWGYGKALYITHPNGYTSVYAHLMDYQGAIEDYVQAAQHEKESYNIELFPGKDELVVQKGQVVARSGNTGGSAAPHLHFELRTSKNEYPQNGLHFGFKIKDDIPPIIREIKVYPKSRSAQVNKQHTPKMYKVEGGEGKYRISQPIPVHGKVGVGIYTHDLLNGANNKNGVYSIELKVDSQRVYFHEMDEFGFHETRYINCHMDYAEKHYSKKKLHQCFIAANNQLNIYEDLINKGVISTQVGCTHQLQFIVKDVYGNSSTLDFTLLGADYIPPTNEQIKPAIAAIFPYQDAHVFKHEGFEMHLPKNALYDTLFFEYNVSADTVENCFAPVHHVHHESTPVHKSYALSIPNNVVDSLKEKAFIAQINKSGQLVYRGGQWVNNKLTTKTKSFGDFSVSIDTIPPSIKGLNIYPGKHCTSSTLKVKIRDNMSGIKSYRGEIDGKWILMEYEPKQARLTHRFDKSLKGAHVFTLEVIDERGNRNFYKASFTR
jgi:hypothetical protein